MIDLTGKEILPGDVIIVAGGQSELKLGYLVEKELINHSWDKMVNHYTCKIRQYDPHTGKLRSQRYDKCGGKRIREFMYDSNNKPIPDPNYSPSRGSRWNDRWLSQPCDEEIQTKRFFLLQHDEIEARWGKEIFDKMYKDVGKFLDPVAIAKWKVKRSEND